MTKVTLDIFSGLPNPVWELDEESAQAIFKELRSNERLVIDVNKGFQGLGYRGFIIEFESSEIAKKYQLPQVFRVLKSDYFNEEKAREIIKRWLEGGGLPSQAIPEPALRLPQADIDIEKLRDRDNEIEDPIQEEFGKQQKPSVNPDSIQTLTICRYDATKFNPGFWNQSGVQYQNNCYNYATNRRTNTFAQPGRGSGQIYSTINCDEVSRAALRDGAHRRYVCFPRTEYPRYLVALVYAPNFYGSSDYHWYRYHPERFWGHKPGGTAARNTDNSGKVITDPRTCDRGPYTQFCGFFYTARSMKVN
jgi:hypothetical protein